MNPQTVTRERTIGPLRGMSASAIFVVMLLAALSLWTAIPLGWIWIGSKMAETQFPAAGPYAVVAVGIVLTILLDAWLIGRLNALYVLITGTNRLAPMRPSWLKSMRDTGGARGTATTVVEAVMMGSVLLAVLVFVGWFFLLAGSPLPNQ
jgi:multisubunit Na+/H+ antiporter MnhB subunit